MQMRGYFDHNATTPLSEEVLAALRTALEQTFGNASSIHQEGQAAKQRLEAARRQVAALIGAGPKDIVFLSGGTEANNLALMGCSKPGDHVITTNIEHPAVLNPCARLRERGIDVSIVEPTVDAINSAMRPQTKLVSVMHANNETGVILPIADIARIAHHAGALLHVDGVQAAGKINVNVIELGVDLYSMSAHKLYAPKGVGALYIRKGVKPEPQLLGGHHERDRRAGTENVPGAVAFGAACEWFLKHGEPERARITNLRDHLEGQILRRIPHVTINGDRGDRLPNTTNLRFDGIEGEAVVIALDMRGFAVSSGSACSSGAVEPSHVLLAMGLTPEQARSSVRFSLGRSNTIEQVDELVEAVEDGVKQLRLVSPVYSHA